MSFCKSLLTVFLVCVISILTFQVVNGSPTPVANPQWGGYGGHHSGGHHGGGHYGGGHYGGGHHGGGQHWGGSRGGHHWG